MSARPSRWRRSGSARSCCSRRCSGRARCSGRCSSALVGIALLWRQADEAQRERWLDTTGRIDPIRAVLRQRRLGLLRPARRGRRADRHRPGAVLVPRRVARHGTRHHGRRPARRRRPRHRRRPLGLPAGLRPDRGAGRAGAHPGARRHGRPPARLGAADARADPEERRRRRRPSPGWRGRRSATSAPGSTSARPPTTAPSPARCAGRRRRSRTPTGCRSRWSTSATAR